MAANYVKTPELVVANKDPIYAPHYAKTAMFSLVEKLEQTEKPYGTLKEEGAEIAMMIAREVHRLAPQSVCSEAVKIAATISGLSREDLRLYSKKQPLVTWRQAGICASILNGKTTTQAARAFGRSDHTTALHAFRVIAKHIPGCPAKVVDAREWFADLMREEARAVA